MLNRDKEYSDEAMILDELQDVEPPKEYYGYIGIICIFMSTYIPIFYPAMGAYMWIGMIIGFGVILYPNVMKYKEVAGKMFFGSETYIGDDDIYEQFEVTDVITVVAAANPFPFAEHCYNEEDITEPITALGGRVLIDPVAIRERITIEVAEKAALLAAEPTIKKALKHWWHKKRHRGKDTSEYTLEEDVEVPRE